MRLDGDMAAIEKGATVAEDDATTAKEEAAAEVDMTAAAEARSQEV
jgi:hypothetical protein